MTPEGKIKAAVKKVLTQYHITPASNVGKAAALVLFGWYYMPVKNQFGTSGIPDFIGHYKGRFFAIETKAPGEKPTGLQLLQIELMRNSGAPVFIVDGPESLNEFQQWLKNKAAK